MLIDRKRLTNRELTAKCEELQEALARTNAKLDAFTTSTQERLYGLNKDAFRYAAAAANGGFKHNECTTEYAYYKPREAS